MPNKPRKGWSTRSIHFDDDVWEALQREAKLSGESAAAIVRRAVDTYLGRQSSGRKPKGR